MATAPISKPAADGVVPLSNAMNVVPERLVKSSERVRDLGEVFTPKETVSDVLAMLPQAVWGVQPQHTFLEPACGDGNFLEAVLERKLVAIADGYRNGDLPAGNGVGAAQFHSLSALASIYAVEISADNIIGGTPGHELGARARLIRVLVAWHSAVLQKRLTNRSPVLRAAQWIAEHNILIGNMLPADAAGRPTGRDGLPLIEYTFDPTDQTASLRRTTLGAVLMHEALASAAEMSLLAPPEAEPLWSGPAFQVATADRVHAPELRGPARNVRQEVSGDD